MTRTMTRRTSSHGKAGILAVCVLSLPLLTGCDVTNPGPVQDEFLAEPASQQGLVNGSIRALAEFVTDAAYTTSILAREIFPSGQTGFVGFDPIVQGGAILPGSFNNHWTDIVQARFIAETSIKRFNEVGAPPGMLYQAHLWAGYTYKTFGEYYCDAVVTPLDLDDATPGTFQTGTTEYFNRAITNFTAALGFASGADEAHAARAGRAAVYAWLGDWTNVTADASTIPDDFVFYMELSDTENDADLYNTFAWANANNPARAHSTIYTFFEDYYTTTGDPRTPWFLDPDWPVAIASLDTYGPVEWLPQGKYLDRNDDMRLASGWEMRLLQAEALLEQGMWESAMVFINDVRTRNLSDNDGLLLAPWTATDLTEAWTRLKSERYIELWLEGRRLPDERRWTANGTPGALDTPDWENANTLPGSRTTMFTRNPRTFCLDIPDEERDLNPNVPST